MVSALPGSERFRKRMKRGYWCIQTYITKEFIFSFIVAFFFFFFIFFINQLLLLAEQILSKKVPILDVIMLIVYSLPSIISITFPFASLVGALMAIGRFSSDNEILAMQSSGIPHKAIFVPLLVMGVLFSLFSFLMNDYFLPLGTINFQKLYRKVLYSNPELELEGFSTKRYQDSVIITGNVTGREIADIVIIDKTDKKDKRIILATNASLLENEEQLGVISLSLSDVFSLVVTSKKKGDYEYFTSSRTQYNILLRQLNLDLRNPGPREMSSVDVWKAITEKRKNLSSRESDQNRQLLETRIRLVSLYAAESEAHSPARGFQQSIPPLFNEFLKLSKKKILDRSLQIYMLEFYKKFSIPFACLAFICFAFPAGLFTKRSGRSVGFGIGLFVTIIFWALLFAGQTMGIRMDAPPFISMWLPDIVILLAGMILAILRFRS